MSKIRVKSYVRHSKRGRHGGTGKTVTVREYTRKVGRKGVKTPKDTTVSAGDEFAAVKEAKLKTPTSPYKGPYMTAKELAAWDAAARKATMSYYGERKQSKEPSVKKESPRRKRKDFEILEDKLASIINKHSKKQYKRFL